eukprot:scaffold83211_cov63-Phaeocystis_antarctica.AAC.3
MPSRTRTLCLSASPRLPMPMTVRISALLLAAACRRRAARDVRIAARCSDLTQRVCTSPVSRGCKWRTRALRLLLVIPACPPQT